VTKLLGYPVGYWVLKITEENADFISSLDFSLLKT
jgi:hypothetical protein